MRAFRTTVNRLTGVSPWNQGTETPGLSRKERPSMSMYDPEDCFLPVIPVDHAVHTPENPFCDDLTCPCHEDEEAIEMVNEAYQEGLITAQDATDIVKGLKSW